MLQKCQSRMLAGAFTAINGPWECISPLPETPLSPLHKLAQRKTEVIYDKSLCNMAAGEDRITDERLGARTAGEGRCICLCRPIAAIRKH